jgi:hypothetical protein
MKHVFHSSPLHACKNTTQIGKLTLLSIIVSKLALLRKLCFLPPHLNSSSLIATDLCSDLHLNISSSLLLLLQLHISSSTNHSSAAWSLLFTWLLSILFTSPCLLLSSVTDLQLNISSFCYSSYIILTNTLDFSLSPLLLPFTCLLLNPFLQAFLFFFF